MTDVFIRRDGVFGGVCGGMALKLDVPVFILRLALFISFFLTFSASLWVYLAAVVSFPSEITSAFGEQPKVLGVCHKLAPKLGLHETWLRFATLIAWIVTAFVPVFAVYMILFLVNAATDESGTKNPSGVRDVN